MTFIWQDTEKAEDEDTEKTESAITDDLEMDFSLPKRKKKKKKINLEAAEEEEKVDGKYNENAMYLFVLSLEYSNQIIGYHLSLGK